MATVAAVAACWLAALYDVVSEKYGKIRRVFDSSWTIWYLVSHKCELWIFKTPKYAIATSVELGAYAVGKCTAIG